MKTKNEIRVLYLRLQKTSCNDSCKYGEGICKFEKRCDLLLTAYYQVLS